MTTRAPSPGQLEQSFARASQLQAELGRKERAIGRKVQVLALGLAGLMEPGAHPYRTGVVLHAFDVDGVVCLAAAYHEPDGDGYRYRCAVLCGGETAKRALRTAVLDPGDRRRPLVASSSSSGGHTGSASPHALHGARSRAPRRCWSGVGLTASLRCQGATPTSTASGQMALLHRSMEGV